MKLIWTITLIVLTFLALSSGIAKMMLMQQEIDVFGKYGFSNPILIAFGALQFAGGVFLVFGRTRFIGAAIVAATFLASLVVLLREGNVVMSVITILVTAALVLVMLRSRGIRRAEDQSPTSHGP